MAEHIRLISSFLGIGSLLCQLVLLAAQLRTYRRTGHSSLLWLSASSVLAVLYLGCSYGVAFYASNAAILVRLSWLAASLFGLQAVFAVWGTLSLLRAFAPQARGREIDLARPVEPEGSTSGVEPAPGSPLVVALRRGLRGMRQLFQLWTLRRVENVSALATERSVVLLGAGSLLLWLSIDRLRAGPGSSFNVFDLPSLGFIVLMCLALAFVMGRRSRPPLPYRQGLFLVVAVLPVLILLDAWIDDHLSAWWMIAANGALIVYLCAYSWRSLHAFSGTSQPRAMLWTLIVLGGFVWLDRTTYLYPSLWVQPDPDNAADLTWTAGTGESLLFDQQRRIDQALGAVMPGTDDKPAVFFVGFAGVGSQKVFAEEIKLAANVVARRYDTAQREVLLINDRRDRDSRPLATVSGLRYVLSGIARKMDLQRDILFLSLSSHGSDAPELSVSNGALALKQVTGEDLAQALRDSGIRWRIIVISACHAGAFIPALQDPSTIIITAAAADKTSFGCSDDRDLTYFGEAFYRDALPKARSLKEAVALADAAIAEREASEHITPSEPQAFFGEAIDRVLSTMQEGSGAR